MCPAADDLVFARLVQDLRSPDAATRARAANELGALGDPGAAESLVQALRDRYLSVRSHVASALARLGDPRALETLLETIDIDVSESDPSRSAQALIRVGPPALAGLAPLLDNLQPAVRKQAVLAMRAIAADRAGAAAVGWAAELQRLLAAYEVDMPPRERARLTKAVVSSVREHSAAIGGST